MRLNASQAEEVRRFFRVFFRRRIVIVGLIIIVTVLAAAIFAEHLTPYDPNSNALLDKLQDPSALHWLGTDSLGRDYFTRLLFGARVSLLVGLVSVLAGCVVGVAIGLIAGYCGGLLDAVVMRIVDAQMSIPPMVLTIALCDILGGGLWPLILSIAVSYLPTYIRLMRSQVLAVRETDYITASEAVGSHPFRTMLQHVLPNCISPIIVLITMNLGGAILTESGLSYLGIGVTPPTATWGSMVSSGYKDLTQHPLLTVAPGILIMLLVLAFNMVGDGLRDALDPRQRGIK